MSTWDQPSSRRRPFLHLHRAQSTDRPDGQPLKVSLDRMSLPLGKARAVVATREGIVAVGRAGLPRVVRDLVVVPDQLPRVRLVQQLQVQVGPVRLVSRSVLVQRPDLVVRLRDAVAAVSKARGSGPDASEKGDEGPENSTHMSRPSP